MGTLEPWTPPPPRLSPLQAKARPRPCFPPPPALLSREWNRRCQWRPRQPEPCHLVLPTRWTGCPELAPGPRHRPRLETPPRWVTPGARRCLHSPSRQGRRDQGQEQGTASSHLLAVPSPGRDAGPPGVLEFDISLTVEPPDLPPTHKGSPTVRECPPRVALWEQASLMHPHCNSPFGPPRWAQPGSNRPERGAAVGFPTRRADGGIGTRNAHHLLEKHSFTAGLHSTRQRTAPAVATYEDTQP